MVALPPEAMSAVEFAAVDVAAELDLPSSWLNSDVQMLAHTLPLQWKTRRVFVGAYSRIRLFAVSRPDLIAMKVFAGRAQDLDDLNYMRIRPDEVEFVRNYLTTLRTAGTKEADVSGAFDILATLKVHDEG